LKSYGLSLGLIAQPAGKGPKNGTNALAGVVLGVRPE
jgi:hypothetical protein